MNVLSLFNGIGCTAYSLKKAGIPIGKLYVSEIDKYANIVNDNNHPESIQLGCVKALWERRFDDDVSEIFSSIDLLAGGSPCQGFSFAGKQLNFDDPRSELFFHFVDILDRVRELNPNVKFMLENVKMKKEYLDVITQFMGVIPVLINSALVCAQNRQRWYWANWEIPQPENANVNWGNIRQNGVDDIKYYYTDKGLDWIRRHSERKNKKLAIWGDNDKCQMIEASHCKKYSSQRFFGIRDVHGLRYITPVECSRAQGLPDLYLDGISDTQKYRCLGNGWQCDTIIHIFKHMPHA